MVQKDIQAINAMLECFETKLISVEANNDILAKEIAYIYKILLSEKITQSTQIKINNKIKNLENNFKGCKGNGFKNT